MLLGEAAGNKEGGVGGAAAAAATGDAEREEQEKSKEVQAPPQSNLLWLKQAGTRRSNITAGCAGQIMMIVVLNVCKHNSLAGQSTQNQGKMRPD